MKMRALSSVGGGLRVSLETLFCVSTLKSRMREHLRAWLEMLLVVPVGNPYKIETNAPHVL